MFLSGSKGPYGPDVPSPCGRKFQFQSALCCVMGCLRLLIHSGFFSKAGSDTFKSVLIYGKEQESRNKNVITVQKIHIPEKV